MRRAFAITAAALLIGWRFRGVLACRLGLRRHDPERVMTAAGSGAKCRRCGKSAATVLELLEPREDGFVDLVRPDQQERLHGFVDTPPVRARFLRGRATRRA